MSDYRREGSEASPPTLDFAAVRSVKRYKQQLYSREPSAARVTKSVSIKLIDTFKKVGNVREFSVMCDEPQLGGGQNDAPQPTEFMLLALGFCQMNILIACAASARIQVTNIEIDVAGHRDNRGNLGAPGVRPGYERIDMHTRITSPEPTQRLRRLVALAEARCPVHDNLSNPTEIVTTVTRDGETIEVT